MYCLYDKGKRQCVSSAASLLSIFDAVNQTGRTLVESDLVWNGEEYRMDYADIEKKISENNVKMLLFCSPHNPIGRVWKREELEKLSEICQKHNVIIVSDEIHHDFVYENFKHIPMTLIQKENTVILTSASKTFNLAGLTTAVAVIPDDKLRKTGTVWQQKSIFLKEIHLDIWQEKLHIWKEKNGLIK